MTITKNEPINADIKFFEKIYKKYRLQIYYYLYMLCNKNNELASELFSITIFSAYKSLANLKHTGSVYQWFKKIASNKYYDYLRSFYRQKKLKNDLHDIITKNKYDPHEQYIKKEQFRILNKALKSLKSEYRTMIELKYFKGLSVIEISIKINRSHDATRSLLQRAKQALRNQIVYFSNMQN